jgi:hypothetical protein
MFTLPVKSLEDNMKEFKVYLTQNYQPITVSAKTQEEAENEVKVRFRKSGHLWEEVKVEEVKVMAIGIGDTQPVSELSVRNAKNYWRK